MKVKIPEKFFKPNKCGSKEGFLMKVLWHIIPNFVFGGACNKHDKLYFLGGVKAINPKARFLADGDFLKEMRESLSKKNWIIRKSLDKVPFIYYKAVRRWGHNSFNWFDTYEDWIKHIEQNEIEIYFD